MIFAREFEAIVSVDSLEKNMESQFGFTKFSVAEFSVWLESISVSRTITKIQEHHTWSPNYSHFNESNHFNLQKNMKDYHVGHNGWADIGQHFSIFPDGAIVSGRPLNAAPACIFGNNAKSVCIENVGDFDIGRDAMRTAQRDAIVAATAALARRFNLNPIDTNNIVYHHWFDLNTGERTNGSGNTKSCPGTAFFGGNKVPDCVGNFLPLVQAALNGAGAPPPVVAGVRYGRVIADTLNIRSGPGASNPVAEGQGPLENGADVRIFEERDNWLRISNSKEYWVFSRWVRPTDRRRVNADDSNVRSGPGTGFPVLSTLMRGDEVFVDLISNGWARIGNGDVWISESLLA